MILKELDAFVGNPDDVDRRMQADRVAYALRRHYRRSRDVDVLNGLRLGSGRTAAEVDHLVVHAHGLLVVERWPVKGRVQIDIEGQWFTPHEGAALRLDSPITRAYVQALMLKALLDRRVRQRGFFDQLELDVLVVVDDDCIVQWPGSGPLAEVCKRDDLAQRIEQRIGQCRDAAPQAVPMTEAERRVLGDFLCRAHRPVTRRVKERP